MNLVGIASVVTSLLSFALAHRLVLGRPLAHRLVALVLLGLMAMPASLFAVYYLHVLPETEVFYELRSWPGSEWLAVFLGLAGGALAACLPRLLLIVPLFGSLTAASLPYLKMALSPLSASALHESWKDDACLQSTSSTCGPASVATVLRSLGINVSERELALAAFSTSSGTEAWYLARQIRRHGVEARFDFRSAFSPEAGLPAVIGVKLGDAGHFIAVLEVQEDRVTYADPLTGKATLPLVEFNRRYKPTGFHLVLAKPGR